jgi:uncharacterized protein YukE
MADEVRVDPWVLATAAQACDDLGTEVKRDATTIDDAILEAVRGLWGWDLQRALQELRLSWQHDLDNLSDYLDRFADALRTCANEYQYTDHANADTFFSIGSVGGW